MSKYEAVKYSGLRGSFPPCRIDDIRQVEEFEVDTCLGYDFRQTLLADLVDYSSASEWAQGTYTAGQFAIYKGLTYKATTTTTNAPDTASDWELADKFTSSCYNELWCGYLAKWLALMIARSAAGGMETELADQGFVKRSGLNFDAADTKAVNRWFNNIDRKISIVHANMIKYIDREIEVNNSTCYDDYKMTDDKSTCLDCDESKTRAAWSNRWG